MLSATQRRDSRRNRPDQGLPVGPVRTVRRGAPQSSIPAFAPRSRHIGVRVARAQSATPSCDRPGHSARGAASWLPRAHRRQHATGRSSDEQRQAPSSTTCVQLVVRARVLLLSALAESRREATSHPVQRSAKRPLSTNASSAAILRNTAEPAERMAGRLRPSLGACHVWPSSLVNWAWAEALIRREAG
jgi:hypothetical protein